MSSQHFLPASYIGRFSLDTHRLWRERSIWVQRVGGGPYHASAEYVGSARRFYDREKPNAHQSTSVDQNWRYEPGLPTALNVLCDPTTPLDGQLWAQVLVPFVSSIFIRGLDFKARYETRIPGVTGPAPDDEGPSIGIESWHDNTLESGQTEWQRLLAPVMAAEWTVVHGSGAPVLATNDVAHCMIRNPAKPTEWPCAVPIDTSTVLVLERRPVRRILDWDGSKWIAIVQHRTTSDDNLIACRQAIKHGAFKEVYGPTRESVAFPTDDFQPSVGPVGPEHILPMARPRGLIPYSWDYFRVLTALESDPQGLLAWDGLLDLSIVAKSWSAAPQYFLNLPVFPGGIYLMHAYRPACSSDKTTTSHVAVSSLYLDLTRFSAEDVDKYRGTNQLDGTSPEATPALGQLVERERHQLLT